MADVFISYSRTDRDRVSRLAAALAEEGLDIWWDTNLAGGAEFSKETESRVKEAKAVLVAWSRKSVNSNWVADEATIGRDKGALVPIAIDAVEPKIGFRQFQTIDFQHWRGDRAAPEFQALCAALKSKITGEAVASVAPQFSAGFDRRIALAAAALTILLISIGIFVWRQNSANEKIAAQSDTVAADDATANSDSRVGLAVLPFVNMSNDENQEFFADGLSEELLNWLGNVEGLRVPGRTTSFQFKGKADDLRTIAAHLGVSYLLEGSVRRSGDTLRITAQLIEATTGAHLWSETYDRTLDDIFEIQEDVARRVTTETLGVIPESGVINPAAVGDVDPKAHELYLEGRALYAYRRRNEAFMKFYDAVKIDPNHALAQAYLAIIGYNAFAIGNLPKVDVGDFKTFIDTALETAVKLQPEAADVLFAQGWAVEIGLEKADPDSATGRRIKSFYERAIRANPRHLDAMHALINLNTDRQKYIADLERLLEIDPAYAAARSNLANAYFKSGDRESALRVIEETLRLFPETSLSYSLGTLREMGFTEEYFREYLNSAGGADKTHATFRRLAAALADLGALEEAEYYLHRAEQESAGVAFTNWHRSLIAYFKGDRSARLQFLAQAIEDKAQRRWTSVEYARALVYADQPEEGLALVRELRPDLRAGAQPQFKLDFYSGAADSEAFTAAKALEMLGRKTEAAPIWRATIDASPEKQRMGWQKEIPIAIAYAHLDEKDKAMERLEAAYEQGFRYLYSFDFDGGVDTDFYDPNGLFAPIYDSPEFQAFRAKVEKENSETLARLDRQFGVHKKFRDDMAANPILVE